MKIEKIKKVFSLCFISFIFFSCASFHTFQSADIVEPRKTIITSGAVESFSLPQVEQNSYDEGNQLVPFVLLRKGLSEKKEVQSFLTPNSFNFYLKNLFVNKQKFVMSGIIGGGYTFIESSFDDQLHIVDVPVGMILTYSFFDFFNITFTPKLIARMINADISFVAGSGLNIGIGKNFKIIPEVNLFYDVRENNIFLSGGIAYEF